MKKQAVKKKVAKKKAVKKAVKKTVVKRAPTVPEKGKFAVSLVLVGEKYEASGKTVTECLNQIKPGLLKSKGIFTVMSDGKKSERVMFPFEMKRLLTGNVAKIVFDKHMTAALK